MALTPIDLQKISFRKKLFGYDPTEVDNLLLALAEELAGHLREIEKLDRENRYYRQRLLDAQQRQTELQASVLEVQKVSEHIRANAQKEADLTLREAQQNADRLVHRAMEQASTIEARLSELRMARRELYLRFKQTVDFFQRIVQAEAEESEQGATVRTLSRPRVAESASDSG